MFVFLCNVNNASRKNFPNFIYELFTHESVDKNTRLRMFGQMVNLIRIFVLV